MGENWSMANDPVGEQLFEVEEVPVPPQTLTPAGATKRFREYNQSQSFLLPPSLEDWLPQDHEARFISDVVENLLDLSVIYDSYQRADGYPPYDPSMMLKLLLFAYSTGVTSSTRDGALLPCERGLPVAGRQRGTGLPLLLALSKAPSGGHRRAVRPGARPVCASRASQAWPGRPRRHQASGVGE